MTHYFPKPIPGGQWPPPPTPPGWVAEVKVDGWRAVLAFGRVYSRGGRSLGFGPRIPSLHLDGEWHAGAFRAFDVEIPMATYYERRARLEQLAAQINSGHPPYPLHLVPHAPVDLADLDPAAEGIVWKRLESRYPLTNSETSDWVKFRRPGRHVGLGGRVVQPAGGESWR